MRAALGVVLAALTACQPAPWGGRGGYTLLFFGRSPAARVGPLTWAPDGDRSRLIAVDGDLRVVRTITDPRLATPVAVQHLGGRLLVTERTGEGVVLDTAGTPLWELESPFPASLYATDGATRIVAARSPYLVQFVAEDGSQPLLWVLDTLGTRLRGLGATRLPEVPYLTQLVNAGAVALDADGAIYFAPLVRDEIVKLDATGATVWRTQRGLFAREEDPRFLESRGRDLQVAHALVGIALALGPDGRLYALGGADSGATALRLDILDPGGGRILDTRMLPGAEAAVAVNRRGRLRILEPDSLLARTPAANPTRTPFAPGFALPTLEGDTLRLADYRGKVTLVNFWASWCDPCREEFPLMAQLYRELDRADFDIAAISDDVDGAKMRAFAREYRPPFPLLVGGGRMKGIYHYRGLPYSVLLDRRGRVVERIFGFGGPPAFRRLRETIAREMSAP